MNPTTEPPIPQLQPPQPPQPHRQSTSCDRHPDEQFTSFCPSCLCERLSVLDTANAASGSTSSRKSAAAAIKAIFKPSAAASSSSTLPELRRTKSFSASKNEGFFSGIFEPQRKSCDVRGRSTLWTLFTIDDETKTAPTEARNLASSSVQGRPVVESKEEDAEIEIGIESEGDEIRVSEEDQRINVVEDRVQEIIEEEIEEEEPLPPPPEIKDFRIMKDHIDLDALPKKPPKSSFWSAASVFSKKLQKWRQKQKMKKRNNGSLGSATLPVEKPIGRQFRETQSEIADYGFGRRSCDTDPRFSLDAARMSFDDPRFSLDAPRFSLDAGRVSFDEPRASWDGYLIGRTFPPRMPTMLSLVEDSPPPPPVVQRTDSQIPVEEPIPDFPDDGGVPGGSSQTRDYYLDSSSRRRKSLDRSNSIRKTAAAVVAEIDELKSGKNAKVSPATMDYCNNLPSKLDPSNSLRDDLSETFEIGLRDNNSKSTSKKSGRWKAWSIWGFIHRRSNNKDENFDRYSRSNGVERSYSESWQDSRRKLIRSNSSVSSRNSSSLRMNGNGGPGISIVNGKKKKDEYVLERNRSARYSYSPNDVVENGLLRFYLNPMRGSRRGGQPVPAARNNGIRMY